jgi:acyl dehydratase
MSWWDDAVGRSAELTRTFSQEDLASYHQLTGDTIESGQVPEPLIAGLFSALLGVRLPGAGTNYLKQSMSFSSLAVVGESLRAVATITSVRPEKRLVRLSTACATADGRVICQGEALVLDGGASMAVQTGTE